jgi:hypothetical protein
VASRKTGIPVNFTRDEGAGGWEREVWRCLGGSVKATDWGANSKAQQFRFQGRLKSEGMAESKSEKENGDALGDWSWGFGT